MKNVLLAEEVGRQSGKNPKYLEFYSTQSLLGMLNRVDPELIEPFESDPLTSHDGNLLLHRRGVKIYKR